MFKMFQNRKGFSLVELIVVIAILGVISAIAIPAVLNTLKDSKVKADVATAQAISKAINVAIVSKNSDTITTNDIGTLTKTEIASLADGSLKDELAITFPTTPTTQSVASGQFSVTITNATNDPSWSVSFTDSASKVHTIGRDGKESIEAATPE